MEHVEQRVGNLERRADTTEQRLDEHGRRLDKYDDNIERVWERMDQHRDAQVRMQTLVEVGNRDISDLKSDFRSWRELQEKQKADESTAEKNRKPKWWQVGLTGVAVIMAIGSLIVGIVGLVHK